MAQVEATLQVSLKSVLDLVFEGAWYSEIIDRLREVLELQIIIIVFHLQKILFIKIMLLALY